MSKKNLVTTLLVMLVVLAAGAAMAGEMNYTIYGKLHMSMDYLNNGDDSAMFLASNTSRFGVKGKSAIDEEYTFIWQFESFIDPMDKGGTLSNRNSFLGVTNEKMGTFLMGIHDTPFKTLGRNLDLFPDQLGDFRQAMGSWDQRWNNLVMYTTPDFSGLSARVAYRFGEGGFGAENMGAFSALGSYKMDAIYVAAALESYQKNYFVDEGETAMGLRLGGSYKTEEMKVFGLFQSLKNYEGEQYDAAEDVDLKATSIGGGAAYMLMPKYWLKAQGFIVDPNTETDDDEGTLLAFGFDYMAAKDLCFYLQYGMWSNGDDSDFTLGGGAHGTSVSGSYDSADGTYNNPSGISFGIWKTF